MIGWGCGLGMFCSGYGSMVGILSGGEGKRAEVSNTEILAEVRWSAIVDSGGFFSGNGG